MNLKKWIQKQGLRQEFADAKNNSRIKKKIKALLQKIRDEVAEKTQGLKLKIGCAPNRFLAKLVSQKESISVLLRDKRKIKRFLNKFLIKNVPNISRHKCRIFNNLGKFMQRLPYSYQ